MQTAGGDAAAVNQNTVIKDNCVKELVDVVAEACEIQKILQIEIEEGAGIARGFNEEQFSFSMSEKYRKEVQKVKKRKKRKKRRKRGRKKRKITSGNQVDQHTGRPWEEEERGGKPTCNAITAKAGGISRRSVMGG